MPILASEALLCENISESFARWLVFSSASTRARASASTNARNRANASARHRALPYHCISQLFDLPPATTSVSHLTCPLPPHHQSELALVLALEIELALVLDIERYRITASVSHLTCPLPPHQSVIWHAHCHHISQSFDLPSTTALPHWSVIWLAPTTTSVNHLTCPLPPIRQSFDLPTASTSLCPHHSSTSSSSSSSASSSSSTSTSTSTSTSASARQLEIIEKFLCPNHL